MLEKELSELPEGEASPRKVDLLNKLSREMVIQSPRPALKLARRAEKIARKIDYTNGLGYSIGLQGYAYYMTSRFQEAIPRFKESLKLIKDIDFPEGEAEIYNGLSSVHLSLGNYEEALQYQLNALKIIQKMGKTVMEGWALYALGVGYQEWGDYDRALHYHRESLKIFQNPEEGKDEEYFIGTARAYTGMGSAYQNMGKPKKALEFHQKSLKIFRKYDNRIGVSRALNDLGIVYQNLNEDRKALECLLESQEIREELGNRQSLTNTLINLGQLHIRDGKLTEALNILKRALQLSRSIQSKPRIFQACRALSEAYDKLGDHRNALKYYKMFHETREGVTGDEAKARLKNLQISYEIEKSEREAEIARLINVELREKNEQLEKLLKELQETQSQLIQSEKMAALGNLVAGVVHEINSPAGAMKSSLDVMKKAVNQLDGFLNSRINSDPSNPRLDPGKTFRVLQDTLSTLENASQRVTKMISHLKSFARIDESPFQKADINEGLESAIALIAHNIPENIEVVRKLGKLPKILCYPAELNQVFMNLLTNALEAIDGKGQITISSSVSSKKISVSIKDTGRGIPPERLNNLFEPGFNRRGTRVKAGIGLFTSDHIIRKHGGEIRVRSMPGRGSTFTILLPVKRDQTS